MFDTTATQISDSDSRTAVQLLRDLEPYLDVKGDIDDDGNEDDDENENGDAAADTLADRLAAYDFDLNPEDPDPDALTFPHVYVGLDVGLLAPGDGVVTDRHHASADRYEPDDPMNQIEGQISPFTLSGWLRHGCEAVVQAAGGSACHPGEANADYRRAEVYERDLDAGYHEKGSCTDAIDHGGLVTVGDASPDETAADGGEDGGAEGTADREAHTPPAGTQEGCLIYDLFGGFGDRPGRLLRRPVAFSPIRRHVDVTEGEAEAHYRQLHTQVRSRNAADGGQPLRTAQRDVVGNVEGTWKLTLRTVTPAFVGLLVAAVEYLDAHGDDFRFQLGGARNFGAGIPQARVLNPLYSEREIRRLYDRAKAKTTAMETKDDCWATLLRPAFLAAFRERVAADARAMGVWDEGDGDSAGPTGGDGA
jgi:hypothetical protein